MPSSSEVRSTPEVVTFSPRAPAERMKEGYLEEGVESSVRSSEATRETWRRLEAEGVVLHLSEVSHGAEVAGASSCVIEKLLVRPETLHGRHLARRGC